MTIGLGAGSGALVAQGRHSWRQCFLAWPVSPPLFWTLAPSSRAICVLTQSASIPAVFGFERMRQHRRLQQQGDDREHGVKRAATHGGATRIEGADEFSAEVQGARWRLRQTRASRGGPLAAVRRFPADYYPAGAERESPENATKANGITNSVICGLFVTEPVDIVYLILRVWRRSGRR